MRRKFIFFSLCLLLLVSVVPSFSQEADNGEKFQKPKIEVIADEDIPEPSAVHQGKDTSNKGRSKGPTQKNKPSEQPKPESLVNTPVPEVNAANNPSEPIPEPVVEIKESSQPAENAVPSEKTENPTPSTEEKTPEQPAEIITQDTQPAEPAQEPELKSNGKPIHNNKGNKDSSKGSKHHHGEKSPEPEPVVPEPVIEPEPAAVQDEYQQFADPSAIPQVDYDIPLDQLDQFADRYEPVYQVEPEVHSEPEPEPQVEVQSEPEPVIPEPEPVPEIKQEPVVEQHQRNVPGGNNNRAKPNLTPEVQQNNQGHRNIEVQRQNSAEIENRRKQQERFEREQQQGFDEADYFKLIGDHSQDYLNQYKVYSEQFFNYVEGLWNEAVVPLYRQVRQHEYLSMGLSSLIGFYIIITFTRLFLSLFRKKPKFRYNKEETISQSDINANFKKFLGELESLKKQISTGTTTKVGGGSAGSEGTVAIPATLQQDLSTIINSLAKNDDAINRVIREKGKSDTFLMDFQKEVVESHKAIWNELYQLRKIFSSGKINTLSSAGKARTDVDDMKSLSSNPEVTDRRREDHRSTPSKTGEPRSKSVTPSDPIRSRPVAPKEKKPVPVEVEAEKTAPVFTPSTVNGHAQEENKPQSASNLDKIPFGRPVSKEEETQPGVQIPTNLENDPAHNPFATGHPTPTVNAKPNIPFGNPALRGKPNVVGKPPANLVQTSSELNPSLLAKPELSASRKSSMDVKGNIPAPVLNMPATLQPTFEQPVDRPEEKIPTAPEQEGTTEDNQTTEEGESENKGGFIPPMKPGGMTPAFPRGKPIVPGNKAVPQVRRTGPPGTTVFKGPPGNLPRPGLPTQIKPSGPIPEGVPKTNNTQV